MLAILVRNRSSVTIRNRDNIKRLDYRVGQSRQGRWPRLTTGVVMAATSMASTTGRNADLSAAALQERSVRAHRMLSRCQMCEHRCGCDRTSAQPSYCRLGDQTWFFRQELSWGDEPAWIPALRVYFSGCNFRCRFCITAPESYEPCAGQLAIPDQMAEHFMKALDEGARSISVVAKSVL